ncbi:MAG: BREX-4 system phosphatase PglZ [Nitrospirae bacterium]|nr:BREX-4 system phosphatase PglZ [Nitrospirota bacterium]
MNFTTLDEFKEHVNSDLKRTVPIRFINVDNLDMWITVKSWLTDICQKSLRLSDFCGGDDLIPNINRLIGDLKKIRENTLLIPLSEYLRINNVKINDILSRIINLEFDNEQSVLFIPMYRMKTVLSEFIKRDQRYDIKILFLETAEDDDYSLTIAPSDVNVDLKGYNITGFKRYYSYWEENPDKPIVLRVNNVVLYKDIISTDKVTVLINDFDVLKYHYGISEIVTESMGDKWQWKELLKRMKSDGTLNGVFASLFNITKYNAKYLFEKWGGCTGFEKWAIWLWSKLESTDGYLRMVLVDKGCTSNTLIENIIGLICKIDTKDNRYEEFYRQRKEYLKYLSTEMLPPSFWDDISKIKPVQRLQYLTDCTSREMRNDQDVRERGIN